MFAAGHDGTRGNEEGYAPLVYSRENAASKILLASIRQSRPRGSHLASMSPMRIVINRELKHVVEFAVRVFIGTLIYMIVFGLVYAIGQLTKYAGVHGNMWLQGTVRLFTAGLFLIDTACFVLLLVSELINFFRKMFVELKNSDE